jgi:hypothetical protein
VAAKTRNPQSLSAPTATTINLNPHPGPHVPSLGILRTSLKATLCEAQGEAASFGRAKPWVSPPRAARPWSAHPARRVRLRTPRSSPHHHCCTSARRPEREQHSSARRPYAMPSTFAAFASDGNHRDPSQTHSAEPAGHTICTFLQDSSNPLIPNRLQPRFLQKPARQRSFRPFPSLQSNGWSRQTSRAP